MDPDVITFAQVMTVTLASLAAFIGITLGARALWRIGGRSALRSVPDQAVRDELHRLQTSVDAIAIEVERISEAQRFTVTLLSDAALGPGKRQGALSPNAEPRSTTPH